MCTWVYILFGPLDRYQLLMTYTAKESAFLFAGLWIVFFVFLTNAFVIRYMRSMRWLSFIDEMSANVFTKVWSSDWIEREQSVGLVGFCSSLRLVTCVMSVSKSTDDTGSSSSFFCSRMNWGQCGSVKEWCQTLFVNQSCTDETVWLDWLA